jgi:hypothetical protein
MTLKEIPIDINSMINNFTAKIGADVLEIILVVAIAANYFNYIVINEPFYKYIMMMLLTQTLGIPFLTKKEAVKKTETSICPYCGTDYSVTSYECKVCKYEVPRPK